MFFLLLFLFFFSTVFPAVITVNNNPDTLTADINVDTANNIQFVGSATATPTLDGTRHNIYFSAQLGQALITVSAGKTARFTNVFLMNFDPSYVSLGAGSALQFLDNCLIDLVRSVDLSSTWSFAAGRSTIRGYGSSLNLVANPSIVVFPNTTVVFEEVFLTSVAGTVSADATGNFSTVGAAIRSTNDLRCVNNTSNLVFRNSHLGLAGDFSFTVGNIFIHSNVRFYGPGTTFAYSSTGNLSIQPGATLLIDRNMNFSYGSDDSTVNARNHIVFGSTQSRLQLNGCTLHTTWTGLNLSSGIVTIQDKVLLQSEARNNAEAITINGTTLIVQLLADSILDVDGIIFYQ